MYDVIVIGAGPAGCIAAKTLSQNGYRVLLIEKFELPRYKSCSGVLIKKTMDLVWQYFNEDVPALSMCEPIQNKGMIFTDDKGKEYRFEQEGFNVWRSSFDNWLVDKAKESGAEIRDCTTAISCVKDDQTVTVTMRSDQKTYTKKHTTLLIARELLEHLNENSVMMMPDTSRLFKPLIRELLT